jgi:hypothetical protein
MMKTTRSLIHQRAESGKVDDMDLHADGNGLDLEKTPMSDDPNLDEATQSIACGIRLMKDMDPPATFLPSVMEAVRARKLPWWTRLSRWARSRKSITFTPLQAASALGMLCAIFAALILGGPGGDGPSRHGTGARDEMSVVLTLLMPEAESVSVIGSFNNWHPGGYEMKKAGDQTSWSLILKLPAGRYEYAFVVDGAKIVPDPGAELYQDDGFGSRNAVMILGKNGNENSI